MAYYKLGINWGSGNPDFYPVLKKYSIVICSGAKMKKGDYVAITRGHDAFAWAIITSDLYPCTTRPELEDDFNSYLIDYVDDNFIADAQIWDIPENQRFQYHLQQGICQIRNQEVLDTFQSVIQKVIKPNVMHETKPIIESTIINDCKKLLLGNHNIILTGAPGTGKTYLAKQIAKALGAEWKLVQFHPSYDYTDFVEGLRPIKDGDHLGFQRKDGVFKEFCKKALVAISGMSFDEAYNQLIEDIKTQKVSTIRLKRQDSDKLGITDNNSIKWHSDTEANNVSSNVVSYTRLKQLYEVYDTIEKLESMNNIQEDIRNVIRGCNASYYWGVLNYILKYIKDQNSKPYVFIIDEINRGEISKVFGELFYSIDPGYRGKKGMVETQYQNLIPKEGDDDFDSDKADAFRNGFYVPENVYIIGTMNDIDRSVESMDFAMRRRFAWKEITAKSRQSMLDDDQAWNGKKPTQVIIDEIKARMDNLNACIIDQYGGEELSPKDKIGLTKAYQIGAAYFLKYGMYNNFDDLWNNHLEGLLYEYLRGSTNIKDKIDRLHLAYNDTTAH